MFPFIRSWRIPMGLRQQIDTYKLVWPYFKHIHKNEIHDTKAQEEFEYVPKYSEEEKHRIFNFLNTSNPDDIKRLSMSQDRLKRLLSKRSSKGDFKSFSDILSIDGLGVKIMEKLCDSILNYSNESANLLKNNIQKKRGRGQILEPMFINCEKNKLESATAIFTKLGTIGWARIDRNNFEITDWELFDYENETNKKLQLSSIIEIVWSIYLRLPKSDIYIMEAEPTILRSMGADANNPRMVHVNLQKAQMIAMLASFINAAGNINRSSQNEYEDEQSIFQHKVYYLRATLSSRLFRTLVGNEKISAEATVNSILNKTHKLYIDSERSLTISESLHNLYINERDVERELLSQILLVILTFYEMCVFENPKAVSLLNSFHNT